MSLHEPLYLTLKDYDPREKALEHFDDFYKAVYGHRWPSIRLALLSKQKFVAVLNNFGDVEKTENFLQMQGAFDLGSFLQTQKAHCEGSGAESQAQRGQNVNMGEIISEKLKHEELNEINSEGLGHMSEVEILSEENERRKDKEQTYSAEMAKTSLHTDLLSSQIDTSRLIQPEESQMQTTLNEFIPVKVLRGLEDYVPESQYYKYYQMQMNAPITVEKENDFPFPEELKVYTFDRGNVMEFPDSTKGIHGVHNFLKVEGSELLAALALDVQSNDRVLDMCSYSGNMAYCIFQTLRPKVLVCITSGRLNTENTFRQHLYDYSPYWKEMLIITNSHLNRFERDELFDKVLINVPSTEDKFSVLEREKNIFHIQKLRQRLKLPRYQCSLLSKAMRMVRPGGTVLYSTSTLSPIQNDGVVSEALKTAWETSKTKFIIKDLSSALEHASYFYNFGDFLHMKYGTLVVPFAPTNFGPKYFCKLVRQESKE